MHHSSNTFTHFYPLVPTESTLLMLVSDFDYVLPPDLIAQYPLASRSDSRLLVLNRQSGSIEHSQFAKFPTFLHEGDVLVFNNSKVFPARLFGRNPETSGKFEMLLLEEAGPNDWWAMVKPGKRAPQGTKIQLLKREGEHSPIYATVTDLNEQGHRRLTFSGEQNILNVLDSYGHIPLPPYISRPDSPIVDFERYQTIYAQEQGSTAAPTAGLHFTHEILKEIEKIGVSIAYVTLHVGVGTFAPVKAELVEEHIMHSERYSIPFETTELVNKAKFENRRIIAVGTTSLRTLESYANGLGASGRTNIYIYPPYNFKIVSGLVTNFHLPKSTLLMLVSAFASPGGTNGRELILKAYHEAINQKYRFFSYGDAMFIN